MQEEGICLPTSGVLFSGSHQVAGLLQQHPGPVVRASASSLGSQHRGPLQHSGASGFPWQPSVGFVAESLTPSCEQFFLVPGWLTPGKSGYPISSAGAAPRRLSFSEWQLCPFQQCLGLFLEGRKDLIVGCSISALEKWLLLLSAFPMFLSVIFPPC